MADGRDFGSMINERRLGLGYSLGQLANRIGTTAGTVRAWERGQATPDDTMLDRIAAELKLGRKELVTAMAETEAKDEPDDGATAAFAAAVFSDAANTGDDEEQSDPAPRPEAPVESQPAADAGTPPAQNDDADDAGDASSDVAPTAAVAAVAGAAAAAGAGAGPQPELVAAAGETGDAGSGMATDDEPPGPETDGAGRAVPDDVLADLPTEAVPVVANPQPAIAVGGTAVATMPRTETEPVTAPATGFLAPVEQFFATVFDPKRRYLFWIRTIMTVIVFLVFLRVLAWAVPQFFDVLGEILDTIESTPTETDPTSVVDGVN